MKKYFFAFLLFSACFSLFAQNLHQAKIFVPPVTGGGNPSDNDFFYNQLSYEIILQYYPLVRSERRADYILRGSIESFSDQPVQPEPFFEEEPPASPVPDRPIPPVRNTFGRREFFSWDTGSGPAFYDTRGEGNDPGGVWNDDYVFNLQLEDRKTGEIIGNQHIVYFTVDASVGDLLSISVYNILAEIPDIESGTDWYDQWLYFSVNALWAPRLYFTDYPTMDSLNLVNFGVGIQADFHFLSFMSLYLGVQLVPNWTVVSSGEEYRDLLLEIPVALNVAIIQTDRFFWEVYGGIGVNISLQGETKPSLFSWIGGFQFGIRAGPGMVVIDPRFAMDWGFGVDSSRTRSGQVYQRYMLQIGIGYKFGFFPRNTGS